MRRPAGTSGISRNVFVTVLVLAVGLFIYLEFAVWGNEPTKVTHTHGEKQAHATTQPPAVAQECMCPPTAPGEPARPGTRAPGAWFPPYGKYKHIFEEDLDESDMVDETELSDDVTILMGAVNINRTGHLGHNGPNAFEEDYLASLKRWAAFFGPETPVMLRYQKRYDEAMAETARLPNVLTHHLEIEDLQAFPYFKDVERIRTSPWWQADTQWLSSVPQGWSAYYNPLVMSKVLMLYELAKENPFKTKYFAWLDAGGICTPGLEGFGKERFKQKVIDHMDGFLITRSDYAGSNEIHGCMRRLMVKLTANHPAYVSKGWLMAGSRQTIGRVVRAYHKVLNTTLDMGCLGTEETIFTILGHTHPHLFHPYYNEDRDWVFNGLGFCAFLDPNHNWQIPEEEKETIYVHEKKAAGE